MPNLKCNVCEQIFTGENASDDIQEHLFSCAVTEIVTEDEKSLVARLKAQFPVIASITYEDNHDYEEPDYLRITRKDGTHYLVAYQYGDSFLMNRKIEDPFTLASKGIEAVEGFIGDVISAVKEKAPQSDIRFTSIRENSGYLGNGYIFSFTINGKTESLMQYKNNGSIAKFVEKIISFYTTDICGVLEKFNDEYTVDGISVNQWLRNHVGKDIQLKEH